MRQPAGLRHNRQDLNATICLVKNRLALKGWPVFNTAYESVNILEGEIIFSILFSKLSLADLKNDQIIYLKAHWKGAKQP